MSNKRKLSFWDMWNLSFGFFGVQIAYALQSANISRIFATLGADPHQLSFFWILPPLMGMIVQPLIGKYSDRTWCKMGRRKPYLLVGAIVAVLVMVFLPNAGNLNFSSRLLLGLNGAMWFGLFSLIFLDTSINVAMQPFKMMVGDMVSEEQKAEAYSLQSLLCNAGSLVGYLFPIFFTWIGIANTAPKGQIPPSVIWSFYCGAAILILCVLYTFMKVKEMNPQEYAEFHGIDLQKQQEAEAASGKPGLFKLLLHGFDTCAAVVDEVEVSLFVRKLDHHERVVIGGFQIVIGLDLALEQRDTLQHLLGIGKVPPEVFVRGLRLERLDLFIHFLESERRSQFLQRLFAFQQPQPQFFKLEHKRFSFRINKNTYFNIIHKIPRSGNMIFLFS